MKLLLGGRIACRATNARQPDNVTRRSDVWDVAVDTQWGAVLGAVVLAVASIPALSAAESGVRACFAEKDDARRLACYDNEVGKMVTRRVDGHVASVNRKPNGMVVVRLDNDEVWEQADDGPDLGLAVGDSVKIERGALGSYWMSGRSSLAIKVRRGR
jgi:hypothetical protein